MLNKINKLKKGDTIGIINPAFPNPQNREYKEMFEVFEKYGFKVKLGKTYTLKGTPSHFAEQYRMENKSGGVILNMAV